MKVQCPICRTWHAFSEVLTLSPDWNAARDGELTDYSLRTVDGRLVAEVWRNIIYDDNHNMTLGTWHWQYHPLDRCCGPLPGGNALFLEQAMQTAVASFSAHCTQIGIAIRSASNDDDKLRAETVIRAVCIHHGVTRTELLSRSRADLFVRARWSAMLALREVGGWSYPRIAKALCRQDHVTVIRGLQSAQNHMRINPDYRDAVARVRQAAIEAKQPRRGMLTDGGRP